MTTQPDSQHTPPRCPYLGIEASNHSLGEAIEYPSFENRCWTTSRPVPLLLTDQATLCLCSGYRQCPRFLAARSARQGQERPSTVPPPVDADAITNAIKELEADVQASTVAQAKSRRRWGWIGAGLIFVSSLLCGGLFAAYVGWQMMRDEIAATRPGNIDTLAAPAQAQTNLQPQTFIIVTATSEPQPAIIAQAPPQDNIQPSILSQNSGTPVYPEAVPPTPAPQGAVPQGEVQQPPPSLSEIAQETNATSQFPVATPILDFGLEVPTRRPTPVLDIPTSTPVVEVEAIPTLIPTDTPQPPAGTPVVLFFAEDERVDLGDCTTLHWHVENVKAVYYENQGVDGRGEHKECLRDNAPGDYNLMVILPNGATQLYTVTVGVILPTNTPAPTPTPTEELPPTPTWTPNVPTDTPTPPTTYGARLEAGSNTDIECSRGSTCELDLYASNIGNAIDNITIRFTEAASWPRQICRLDGVCSEGQITLVNMGVSNTGVIRLRITVPEDAPLETYTYKLQAVSDGSGGTVASGNVTVKVTATDSSSDSASEE
jgi:hypothetical protein